VSGGGKKKDRRNGGDLNGGKLTLWSDQIKFSVREKERIAVTRCWGSGRGERGGKAFEGVVVGLKKKKKNQWPGTQSLSRSLKYVGALMLPQKIVGREKDQSGAPKKSFKTHVLGWDQGGRIQEELLKPAG